LISFWTCCSHPRISGDFRKCRAPGDRGQGRDCCPGVCLLVSAWCDACSQQRRDVHIVWTMRDDANEENSTIPSRFFLATAIQPSSVIHVASASAGCSIDLVPRAVDSQEAVLEPLMSHDIQPPKSSASPQTIPVLLLSAADCVSEFARSLAILMCLVFQALSHLAPRSFWLLGHRQVLRVIG
jgi:hypothetical protein